MNTFSTRKVLFLTSLITTGLAVGLGFSATVTAAESTAPVAHSDGMAAAVSDTAITAKVKAKLMGKNILKYSHVEVTTTNGVVTLNGTASTSKAKSFAASEAKLVDDVKSVDNNLRIPGSSKTVAKTERAVSDSWITTKVKSELLADSLTKGFEVNVETTHGVVVLKGTLANQDAIDHVKNVAAKVDSVKSVDVTGLTVAKT